MGTTNGPSRTPAKGLLYRVVGPLPQDVLVTLLKQSPRRECYLRIRYRLGDRF